MTDKDKEEGYKERRAARSRCRPLAASGHIADWDLLQAGGV